MFFLYLFNLKNKLSANTTLVLEFEIFLHFVKSKFKNYFVKTKQILNIDFNLN